MNVFLLGAGFGTRLRPLTNHTPKPLLPMLGIPVINYNIFLFYRRNLNRFVINAHHLKECYHNFQSTLPVDVVISYEDEILGTGGGIRHAIPYFEQNQPVMVMNGDIVYDFDIDRLKTAFNDHKPLATLVVKPSSTGNVTINSDGIITSMRDKRSQYYRPSDQQVCFTGLHMLSWEMVQLSDSFCIVDDYMKQLDSGNIRGYLEKDGAYWNDIGTPESYQQTGLDLQKYRSKLSCLKDFIPE